LYFSFSYGKLILGIEVGEDFSEDLHHLQASPFHLNHSRNIPNNP